MPEKEVDPNDVLRALLHADAISIGYDSDEDDFYFFLTDEQKRRIGQRDEAA